LLAGTSIIRGYQVEQAARLSTSATAHIVPQSAAVPRMRMSDYVLDVPERGGSGTVLTGNGRRFALGRRGCFVMQRMAELFVREPAESGCPSADSEEEAKQIDLTSCVVFETAKAHTSAREFHSTAYSRPRSRDTTNIVVPFRMGDGDETTLYFGTVTQIFRVEYRGKNQVCSATPHLVNYRSPHLPFSLHLIMTASCGCELALACGPLTTSWCWGVCRHRSALR
jgi:hypothetical protein